ncbi:Uncharacterised protein [Mycobacteroides abscessus]|nr:Uncharacterised protein [Mycobacteroides abscessus]
MYRARSGEPSGDASAAWNQACWSDVWFGTRSTMIRMPRACAWARSSSKSASVPNSGSTSR